MAELDPAWERRIAELLAQLPPLTAEDCRRGAAIFATARPARRGESAA